MKVLHVINNLGAGGAEKLIEESLPIMNGAKGIKVELLLLSDQGNVFDEGLRKSGISIDVIPGKKIANPLNIYHIRKYILVGKYDVVHAHLFPTIYWVSIASKLMWKNKPKFFYTEHSTHNRRRNKRFLRPVEKFIYSSFEKIISISDATQENLIKWLKPSPNYMGKFTVSHNGINIKKFKDAKTYVKSAINDSFSEDTQLLCMVARFSEAKDQPTIIKAMQYIPENIHLLLVGEGPLKCNNEQLAEDMAVENRVHFLGFRNDIERILRTCDIIIQSSNWEGFGLAAIEGMAAGKPVIASDVEGLREVVCGAGMLFEKSNVEELVSIIKLMLEDSCYNECVKLSFNRASKYNIDIMSEKTLHIYKTLC
ncbi:MAG: glycosyltransferase [Senegalia sp. (in: firmicutes)]|uniref:glycosyltransferase n=1 Tax=Bacillota TaxID=1239 RepID=UPI003F9D7214